jgi:hypothetical protein
MEFVELTCPICHEDDFDEIGMALHFADCDKASTIRNDYEVAQAERKADRFRDRGEWKHEAAAAQRLK